MHAHGTTERYDEGDRCPACVVAQIGREIQANRDRMRRTLAELLETEIELEPPIEPDPGQEPDPADPVSP